MDYTSDIFDALDIQDELQTLYTSGTVFHAFLGKKLPDWKAAAALVRKIAENYRLPYYTLSPTYSVCRDHGYIAGEHFTCPTCGRRRRFTAESPVTTAPVQNWNDGKAQEYKNRTVYDIVHSTSPGKKENTAAAAGEEMSAGGGESDGRYLFTTADCPNCRIARQILSGEEYTVVDAAKHPEMASRYEILQAPTLVVIQGGRIKKYVKMLPTSSVIWMSGWYWKDKR